ncbi:hypothetical protein [Nocardia sp. NPDC057440]|uniref:hypothetical protein n=1 Tax=Nocardia sp. NPDC057440 TaxID=3346134 RepID=UPI00366F3368
MSQSLVAAAGVISSVSGAPEELEGAGIDIEMLFVVGVAGARSGSPSLEHAAS